MVFEIKSRWDGSVLFSLECGSLKLCVEAAVKANAYLAGADLAGAYLAGAYLADAKGFTESHWLPQIQGSRHFVRMAGDRVLKIGCIAKPIEWWLENNVRCGEENDYTSGQIAEYRRYIELIAAMYPANATAEQVKHES